MFKECSDVLKYFILFLQEEDIFSLSFVNKYNYSTLKQSKLYNNLSSLKSQNQKIYYFGLQEMDTLK